MSRLQPTFAAEMNIDLRLAVNYVPACLCLSKLLVFLLATLLVIPGEQAVCYSVLGGMLYMDRIITRNIIFDANAILLAVFFSHIYAVIRSNSTHRASTPLVYCLHIAWAASCVILIAEPLQFKQIFERRARIQRWGSSLLMVVIVVIMSYFHADFEPIGVLAGRSITFTMLSFAWIYIVGLHSAQGIEHLKESSCQFISKLAPLLYSPIWVSAAFFLAAVGGLAYQYILLVHPEVIEPAAPTYQAFVQEKECTIVQVEPEAPSDEEVFRMAKQTLYKPKLASIPEST